MIITGGLFIRQHNGLFELPPNAFNFNVWLEDPPKQRTTFKVMEGWVGVQHGVVSIPFNVPLHTRHSNCYIALSDVDIQRIFVDYSYTISDDYNTPPKVKHPYLDTNIIYNPQQKNKYKYVW